MAFKPGQSGNPQGKPKGAKDKRTQLRQLLEPHAEELVALLVEMARNGDMTAMRLCIDRLIPPVRESRVAIDLPHITDAKSCDAAQSSIVDAVATGGLLPGEGEALSSLVENRRRALESLSFEARIEALEARHADA